MSEAQFDESTSNQALPHSIEAEQAVLGGLMLKNEAFDAIIQSISESDFYRKDHQLIFAAMQNLAADSQPFDPITLSESLQNNNKLASVGGAQYLVDLAQNTPSSANVQAYTQIVLERSIVRQLILAASDIVRKGYNPLGWDSSELLSQAERRLQQINDSRPKKGGFKEVNLLLSEAVERLDKLAKSKSNVTGLSTGFINLDNMTSGWQDSDLVVVAGRPSMGKTAFAMNMVEHAVTNRLGSVLVFSLEMPANQLIIRLLSSIGKIDQHRLRTGKLSSDDWPRLNRAAKKLKDCPLFIDDTAGITPFEMRNRVKEFIREREQDLLEKWNLEHGDAVPPNPIEIKAAAKPKMVMVDYLQLMSGSNPSEGRVQEISQISRELKKIARENKCPVLALSQLSRNVEQRPNKRPVNADLRDSGAIEQDADVIVFIYRDEVYDEDSPDRGRAEIIIGKQRNGPIGTCYLAWLDKYTRFENLADEKLVSH
ncbi:MAG: replicative DNA helicase [Cellvibrionales bacterium TMED148]|nr:replicative DNA helicase [Porticoccaceae bacterium]RPG89846.1 MAG: replicative DNA helicase [Cellvibrionales bacterium TMED148]